MSAWTGSLDDITLGPITKLPVTLSDVYGRWVLVATREDGLEFVVVVLECEVAMLKKSPRRLLLEKLRRVLARIDLARATAIVVPSVPVLSLLVTFVLVGEVPTGAQWLGMGLTVAGVLAFVLAPHAVSDRERIPTQTAPVAVEAAPVPGEDRA